MDWRHLFELFAAGREVYGALLNICVWNKSNGGMGSFYRSKHEHVCVYRVGQPSHLNNVQLGATGRYRTNVWDYDGVNTFREGRPEELAMHPTVKPVALVADAIKDASKRRQLFLTRLRAAAPQSSRRNRPAAWQPPSSLTLLTST